MKGARELLAGIVLVLVLGTAGFFYRNILERPLLLTDGIGEASRGAACTADAKICPDGTVVGKTGANCSFAACAYPNVEITLASTTLAFVLPSGYQAATTSQDSAGSDLLGTYTQTNVPSDTSSTITLRAFPIPDSESGSQLLLSNTQFIPSGLTATTTDEFKNEVFGKNTYSTILIGVENGTVQSAYYLQQGNELFRFDIIERDVQNAATSSENAYLLPQHQALQQLLATLTISTTE